MDELKKSVHDRIGENTKFALPERVVRHNGNLLRQECEPQRRWVKVDPYVLDAYVFERPEDETAARQFDRIVATFDEKIFSSQERCRAGRWKIPYFCGVQGDVSVIPRKISDKDPIEERGLYKLVIAIIARMCRLSGGLLVNLHEEKRGAGPFPKPDTDGVVELYPWMHPPGESADDYYRRLFGSLISKDGDSILTYLGVPGRGVFVRAGKRNAVQCIGNNWYFLFSVLEYYNDHSSEQLITRALAETLHYWQRAGKKGAGKKARKQVTRKQFVEKATHWADWHTREVDNTLKEQAEKIELLRTELARYQRSYHDLHGIRAAMQDREARKKLVDSLPGQWRRIRINEHVASLNIVSDGIHVTMRPIAIEHDGHTYPMGRFIIRISKVGVLSVWNEDRLHPKGVPHPHINGEGTPCMGNATSAVDRAASEHRYADAVEYTIRWLVDGYEEKLALHKIQEWPCEEVRDGKTISCVTLDAIDIGEVEVIGEEIA